MKALRSADFAEEIQGRHIYDLDGDTIMDVSAYDLNVDHQQVNTAVFGYLLEKYNVHYTDDFIFALEEWSDTHQ